MNSICLRRAGGLGRIAPPGPATKPPNRPSDPALSVRLTSRTRCSVSVSPLTQAMVRPGVTRVAVVLPSIWTS